MQTWKLAPLALLLTTSTAIGGPPTEPSCWMSVSSPPPGGPSFKRWADTTQRINVYVDTSTTPDRFGGMHGVQSISYNPYYVAKATEIAVERWNEQAGIPQRLVFEGFKTDSPDNPRPPNSVVIEAGGCIRPVPERPIVASAGCTPDKASGFCTTGTVTLHSSYFPYCDTFSWGAEYSDPNDQTNFVDVLVHELGHTLGRSDAHESTCGVDLQTTVMETSNIARDLTDFDRSESQAVYGSRAATNVLRRRMLVSTTSAWGAPTNVGVTFVDIAPGPGSSWGFTSIPVTTVRFINNTTTIAFRLLSGTQGLSPETLMTGQFPARKPASTSLGPTGSGVMAYMAETGGNTSERQLCIRRRTNGVWSAEGCSNPCASGQLSNNAVSTAYDPVSGRFLVAHACEGYIRVSALATSVDCTSLKCAQVSALRYVSAAETPVVACEPGGQVGSNCRLVYAQRNVVGQRIAWQSFGFVSDPYGFNNAITFGVENQTRIESPHAPAVTYYGDAFQMALTRNGTLLQTYYMFPWSTEWTFDGTLNSTGWISPPFYSPTKQCVSFGGFRSCEQLHLFWVQYRSSP
jgi:hypothetical protein